jgi:NADH-quinone oxidoreductase subunit G
LVTETYFAWARLFETLGGVPTEVHSIARGEDDELLIRADKGANSRGAAWVLGEGAGDRAIRDRVAAGEVDTLVVFGDALDPDDAPPVDDDMRGRIKHLIYVGPFLDTTARKASLLLPMAGWAEENGSFVNFEGRVQWTRRCHRPPGEGRPGWRIARDVAEQAGVDLPAWGSAADVLDAMAAAVESFKEVSEARLGLLGLGRSAATV